MLSAAAELFRGKMMSVPQAIQLATRGPGFTAAGHIFMCYLYSMKEVSEGFEERQWDVHSYKSPFASANALPICFSFVKNYFLGFLML